MTVLSSYNEYIVTVNDLGDSILNWADPDHYRGHIEVCAYDPVFFCFTGWIPVYS
jgi:hypothetical protein